MAIEDVRVLRSLQMAERMGDKQTKQITATQELLIICDAKDPPFGEILEDESSWPKLGGPLPQVDDELELTLSGKRVYCTSRDLSYYKDNERAVVMTVRYEGKDPADDDQPEPPDAGDPNAYKRVTISSTQITQPCLGFRSGAPGDAERAGNGQNIVEKPAINSAGDPVDGLEEETSLLKISYTNTQVPFPNFERLRFYVNKCNAGLWNVLGLGCSFYTVRCTGFSAEYDQKNSVWSVTVEFFYNPKGWEIRFYDVGFNEIVDGKRKAILDVAGNPVSKPVALDGTGKAVAISTSYDTETGVPADPATRVIYPYPALDLSALFIAARI